MTTSIHPVSPPAVEPSSPHRRDIRPFLIAGAIVAVAAIGALITIMALSANGGTSNNPGGIPSQASATSSSNGQSRFELTGHFTLLRKSTSTVTDGYESCTGVGGFDDIREGTQVTVYGASGEVLATGALSGATAARYPAPQACTFRIGVQDVPDGQEFYQVEVGHRGKIAVPNADARAGRVSLTLG